MDELSDQIKCDNFNEKNFVINCWRRYIRAFDVTFNEFID